MKERSHFEDQGVKLIMLLSWNFKEYESLSWTGLTYFKEQTGEHANKYSVSIKYEHLLLAPKLLAVKRPRVKTFEKASYRLSRNVGKELPLYAA